MKKALIILEDDSIVFKHIDCRQTARAFIAFPKDNLPDNWKYCVIKLRGEWYHFMNYGF
jgi:hypothetical protein